MNLLDNELIPAIHNAARNNDDGSAQIELHFYILEQ